MDDAGIIGRDPQEQVTNNLDFKGEVGIIADPLALDIPDEDLVEIVTNRVETSRKFFEEKYNLKERRRKNEQMLFGRRVAELEEKGELKKYQTRSSDNALYEIESSLKPLAMSKLPDIIVTAGGDDPERIESAKNLSLAVDTTNKKREQREVLGLGFKHLPAYFTAVIKTRWDPEKGKKGDYRFDIINPEYIVVDHTAVTKNVDDMSFVAHASPMSIQELIMRFPKKKEEILEQAKLPSRDAGASPTWKELATEIKPWEIWFDWYKRKGKKELLNKEDMESFYEPGIKWERVSGVLWKFGDVILDKMLDPNFDQKGEEKYFSYEVPGDESTKKEVDPQDMLMAAMNGQEIPNLTTETVFHNYFDRPHKPFYFFGYDQWGKIAYDETSRIEQNIRNQENLDDMNRTIIDQLKTRVKHIWSKDSGMDKGAVQRLDMDDPRMDALVEGNPNNVHAEVQPERPDQAQFNALQENRQRMYGISGSQALRGNIQKDTAATNNQMAREADFTRTDDLVEDTINSACEWMAEWQMQFIKLRYTEEHLSQIMGAKGKMTYIRLRRDMISDGMEVMIKASSTDKLKAQRNAMDTAKLGAPFTNPLDFFSDMDMNDPEGRTERGMMFANNPPGYFSKYVLELDTPAQQAQALAGAAGGAPVQGGQPAQPPTGQNPQNPSPQDASNVAATPPVFPQGSPRAL